MARMPGTPVLPQPQGCPKATPATKRDPPGHNMGYERKRDEVVLSSFATKDPSGLRRPRGHLTTLAVEDCCNPHCHCLNGKGCVETMQLGLPQSWNRHTPPSWCPCTHLPGKVFPHAHQSVKSGRGDPQSVKSGRGDFQPNLQMLMQATGNTHFKHSETSNF